MFVGKDSATKTLPSHPSTPYPHRTLAYKLYRTLQYHTVLYRIECRIVLSCIVPYCTVLYCADGAVLHCVVWFGMIVLHRMVNGIA